MKLIKKHIKKHLEKIRRLKKRQHHPLLHHIHKHYEISRKTLFYIKEYGPHTNITKTIVKESIKIMLLASIISSFGGLALENIKPLFISILPLVILLPTLNGMIGGYGTIISSRFSTMLHEGEVKKEHFHLNPELRELLFQVFLIAMLTTIISTAVSLMISHFTGFTVNYLIVSKIFAISVIDVILLVSILFLVAVFAGIYYFKKQEDPNNFLIPITTSIADFGNMLLLAVLVMLFF